MFRMVFTLTPANRHLLLINLRQSTRGFQLISCGKHHWSFQPILSVDKPIKLVMIPI